MITNEAIKSPGGKPPPMVAAAVAAPPEMIDPGKASRDTETVAATMDNGLERAEIQDRLKSQFGLTSIKALMITNEAIVTWY